MKLTRGLVCSVGLIAAAIGPACNNSSPAPKPTDAKNVEEGDTLSSRGRTFSGPVDSVIEAEGRTAVILWDVFSASPDYAYKFGEGIVANGRFSISLPGDPPAEAINSFGVGVGIVVVLPEGKTLADGKVARSAFSASEMLGMSTQHSVIWRAEVLTLPAAPPSDFWPLSFPAGYSCGVCAPKPDSGSFDAFAPTTCDEVRITTYAEGAMCNWT